jgi:hypothetical protein
MPDQPSFTRDELDQQARDLLRTRRRGVDVKEGSPWDLDARVLGALSWGVQAQSKVAWRLLDRAKSFGQYLRQYAYEAGVGADLPATTVGATKATGRVILRSTTGSQVQPAGTVLRHADGTEYTLDANATTSATATLVLRAGHRSGRRRLYQGHAGAGFVTVAPGMVFRFARTGELCALEDTEQSVALQRYLFDLYIDLDDDPQTLDQFSQELGAVGAITAKLAGARANKESKDVLTIVGPVGTILGEATILYTRGGADVMAPAAQQAAIDELDSVRAGTGTIEDIRQIALSYPRARIRECYVIPATHGISTYTLLPILAEGQYLGPALRADVIAYVAARLSPVDKLHAAGVYEEVDTAIATLNVAVAENYEPDWTLANPSQPGLTVTTTGSQSLVLSAVDDIAVNDRVIVSTTGIGTGSGPYIVQRRVTSLVGLTVGLDLPLPYPPGTSDTRVTPGGPLADSLIEAIYQAYEARAPSVASTGPEIRFPPPAVSDDEAGICAAVSTVPGVVDAEFLGGAPVTLTQAGGVLLPGCTILMRTER